MKEELVVSEIENGTVIDHIEDRSAFRLLNIIGLDKIHSPIYIGIHLPSTVHGFKDIIKLEDFDLDETTASQIAVFSPMATVNVIKEGKIIEKVRVKMPEKVEGIISCLNPNCITNSEKAPSTFFVVDYNDRTHLTCTYCRKTFPHERWIEKEGLHV